MSTPLDIPPADPSPDTLTRPRLPFWRRLGGEGLAVSILIHVALVAIALVWVIATITDQAAKKDPEAFVTGAGGGNGGQKAKEFKTRLQPKNIKALAKTNARITTKNANSTVAISSLPVSAPSMSLGGAAGGNSKGFGGGSGGGIGSGKGAGVGGGKNFVSMFGAKLNGGEAFGIVGTFYDFKQDRSGKPTAAMGDPANQGSKANGPAIAAYRKEVHEFLVERKWSITSLSDKYRAPDVLWAAQIFIPNVSADMGPKAYGVEKTVKPSRWIAHYKGAVKVPQTAKFRFVGMGDDFLCVKWSGRVVLDSGYDQPIVGGGNIYPDFGKQKFAETHPSKLGKPLRCGPWLTMTAGQSVPLEIVIGETPGGLFAAFLLFEVADAAGKGTGLKLVRFADSPLPAEIAKGHPDVPNVDMLAKGWLFKPVKQADAR
ncbi:MAG: hypothetical protein WCJ96_08200 [Verrucomicrobiota bacterium]